MSPEVRASAPPRGPARIAAVVGLVIVLTAAALLRQTYGVHSPALVPLVVLQRQEVNPHGRSGCIDGAYGVSDDLRVVGLPYRTVLLFDEQVYYEGPFTAASACRLQLLHDARLLGLTLLTARNQEDTVRDPPVLLLPATFDDRRTPSCAILYVRHDSAILLAGCADGVGLVVTTERIAVEGGEELATLHTYAGSNIPDVRWEPAAVVDFLVPPAVAGSPTAPRR